MAKVSKYSKEGQTEDSIGAPSSFNLKSEKTTETELSISEIAEQLTPTPVLISEEPTQLLNNSVPTPEDIPVLVETISKPIQETIKPTFKPTKESIKPTTMPETNPIIIKLEKPAYVRYTMQNTGEESTRIVHDQKVALSRGTIYKLPISNPSLNLQTSYVIRAKEKFADIIRILNVNNGCVTIEPLIHGIILVDNDEVAVLI